MNGKNHLLLLLAVMLSSVGIWATETAAQPTPIDACGVISSSGSYVLTNNLSATGNCLSVRADNVSIDLSGFTIQGDGTGRGIDVGAVRTGVAIRNGTVRGFARGIDFEDSNVPMAERITFISNPVAGLIANSTAIVKDSVFFANGTGIFLQPSGVWALLSGNYLIFNQTGVIVRCPANILGNTILNSSTGDNLVLNGDPSLCNIDHTLAP